jgi:DNA-binding response OmpR family regulator
MARIFVVEDDVKLCRLIKDQLAIDNHTTEFVHDGHEGMQCLKVYSYDLIILDWELPGATGMEILADFRRRGGKTSVLVLTGRDSIDDKLTGLDAGADDYLTKPFHGNELAARVRALLRRPEAYLGEILRAGELSLDAANFQVKRGNEEIKLLPKEFALLEFFMRSPNRVFPQAAVLNRVWPNDSDATVDALTTCMGRLRKKIDVAGQPSIIRTVHGVGYRLVTDDQE